MWAREGRLSSRLCVLETRCVLNTALFIATLSWLVGHAIFVPSGISWIDQVSFAGRTTECQADQNQQGYQSQLAPANRFIIAPYALSCPNHHSSTSSSIKQLFESNHWWNVVSMNNAFPPTSSRSPRKIRRSKNRPLREWYPNTSAEFFGIGHNIVYYRNFSCHSRTGHEHD